MPIMEHKNLINN